MIIDNNNIIIVIIIIIIISIFARRPGFTDEIGPPPTPTPNQDTHSGLPTKDDKDSGLPTKAFVARQRMNHRWNRNPRPRPKTFGKLVLLT